MRKTVGASRFQLIKQFLVESVLIALIQVTGALVAETDENIVAHRFEVETEYARIIATGTQFLVAREEHTPLEWFVALNRWWCDF